MRASEMTSSLQGLLFLRQAAHHLETSGAPIFQVEPLCGCQGSLRLLLTRHTHPPPHAPLRMPWTASLAPEARSNPRSPPALRRFLLQGWLMPSFPSLLRNICCCSGSPALSLCSLGTSDPSVGSDTPGSCLHGPRLLHRQPTGSSTNGAAAD